MTFMLYIFDEYFAVSHADEAQCLVIGRDPHDGTLRTGLEDSTDIPFHSGRYIPIDCIFGVYEFLRGPYLAVVTGSSKVPKCLPNMSIFRVQNVELLLIPQPSAVRLSKEQEEDEQKYIQYIHSIVESKCFYFSSECDITNSLQRIRTSPNAQVGGTTLAERADRRFCWNFAACELFLEKKMYKWILPIMQAHIEIVKDLSVRDKSFDLVYISRRSCRRQGTRFTMRGIDKNGDVTNFVETEQACFFHDGRKTSLVQIRGSIPIFWSSPVSMKYAPVVYQNSNSDQNQRAFEKHMEETEEIYGRVLIINLIDQKKEQQKLGNVFRETVSTFCNKNRHNLAQVRFVWFDFHHECRKMRWFNLEKLIKQVEVDFEGHGFFCEDKDGNVLSTQSGVVRTNCMDNLDRTNVVQSLFGRRSVLLQLGELEAVKGNVLESPFREFEAVFKNVWGNNADAISFMYAGTGALKTDFTRTGKRTKKGVLMDGYNSCLRYYLNNFEDGKRQDSIDLILKRYVPSLRKLSPLRPYTRDIKTTFLTYFGVLNAIIFTLFTVMKSQELGFLHRLSATLFTSLAIVLAVFYMLVKKETSLGKKLVCRPLLCPEDGCSTTWK